MKTKKHKKVDIPKRPEWYQVDLPKDQIVTVQWHNQGNDWWNETCADVLEVFGLPGNRFYYKPFYDHMTFSFKNKKDAELCRILLSERL